MTYFKQRRRTEDKKHRQNPEGHDANTAAFILKLLSSCLDHLWDYDFSFNRITIKNLDNSGIYAPETDRNIMYTSAVAIIFAAVIHPVQRVNH